MTDAPNTDQASATRTCWFCQREYPVQRAGTRTFHMYMLKKPERVGGKLMKPYRWRTLTILACPTCTWLERIASWSEALLAGGAVFAIVFLLIRGLNPALAAMFGFLGAVLAGKITIDTRSKRLTERDKAHPALRQAVKEGWQFGKNPRRFGLF